MGWRVCCGWRWKISCSFYRDGLQEISKVVFDRFVDFDVLDFWSDVVCVRDGCRVGGGDGAVAISIASLDFVKAFGCVLSVPCARCRLNDLGLCELEVVSAHLDYCDASPFSRRRLSLVYSVFPVQTICPSIDPLSRPPFVSSCRRRHRDHFQHLLCLALRRSRVFSIVLWSQLSLSLAVRHCDYPHS
jgi:hypothetical protein